MTLHQFTIFAAIAKHRNVTRASHEIHVTQPCVSQQMRLLQQEYGIKLYTRSAKGVELTQAGRSFLSAVSPILDQVGRLKNIPAQRAAAGEPDLLAVGGTYSSSTILLPSLLSRFKRLHPKTEINFRTNNGVEIEHLLLKQTIEIALTTSPPKSPRIIAAPFRREKLALVVSRKHPLARARTVSLRDVERTPLLVRSSGGSDGTTVKHLKCLAEQKGIKLNIGMRFESPSAIKEAIQRNMGIGILYEDVAKYNLKRGEFKALNVVGLKLEGQSYVIYLHDRPLSKSATDFLHLLRSSQSKKRTTRKPLADARHIDSFRPTSNRKQRQPAFQRKMQPPQRAANSNTVAVP